MQLFTEILPARLKRLILLQLPCFSLLSFGLCWSCYAHWNIVVHTALPLAFFILAECHPLADNMKDRYSVMCHLTLFFIVPLFPPQIHKSDYREWNFGEYDLHQLYEQALQLFHYVWKLQH